MLGRSCALLLCIVALALAECEKECDECYECQVNNKGEEKCVRKAQCCGEEQGSVQCLMSPCHDQMQKCPSARMCVPQYCEPECTAHYYDQDLNEMTTEQCNPEMDAVLKRCSHKPDEGNGDEVSERYYYNRVYRACQTFQYTVEGGNDNNFNTESGCMNVCGKITGCPTPDLGIVPPGCRLSMETQSPDGCFYPQLKCDRCASNPCPNCHTCEMNEDDEGYCCKKQALCVGAPEQVPVEVKVLPPDEDTTRTCRMDKDPGDGKWCEAEYDYFYYDRNLASCQGFKWGCRGNDNIFTTKEECETKCSGVPPCPMASLSAPPSGCIWNFRAGLNGCTSPLLICKDTDGCQEDTCGKCSVCSNVYADDCKGTDCKPIAHTCEADKWCENYECTDAACDEGYKCVFTHEEGAKCEMDVAAMAVIRTCRLEADSGPCLAALPMIYFDFYASKCENFTYGGCQGNKNSFKTVGDCMEKCGHVGPCPVAGLMVAPVGCTVESDIGLDGCPHQKTVCPGAGCDKEPCLECEKCKDEWPTDCEPQYGPVSLLPPGETTKAPCMPRGRTCTRDPVCEKWKCEEKKCKAGTKCVWKDGAPSCEEVHFFTDTLLTCRLPKAIGPCRAAHRSWYYNSLTGQCQSFTYGGCNGNANRFDSKHECEVLCAGVPSCTVEDLPEYSEGCVLESFIQEDGCPGFEMTCESAVPVRAKPKEGSGGCRNFPWGGPAGKALALAECEKECDECYECQVNNKGEKKCVRQAQCCGAEQGSLQCLVSPCHDQMQKCPSARMCVPQYCEPECTAHYYDQDLNEMTSEQCNPEMDPVLKRCSHKPDEGNGDEVSERYYYNRVYRACQTFQYTGEGGNDNNFNTESGFMNVCGKTTGCPCPTPDLGIVPPGCRLSMETQSPDGCFYPQLKCDRCASNPCPNCHTCEMNDDEEGYCCKKQELCVGAPEEAPVEVKVLPPDVDTIRTCRMDKDPGEGKWCEREYDYFYYDRNLASCQGFKWGCRGNDNTFRTKEECENKCSGVPPCPMASLSAPPAGCIWNFRAGLNGCTSPLLICKDTDGCQEETCGKCSVCSNVYAEDCKGSDCKPISHTCEADKWCEKYECEEAHCDAGYKCVFLSNGAKCEMDVEAMEAIRMCRLNSDPGPCEALATMVYFDKFYAKCENFAYGGCQGNKNRFTTIRECMEKCGWQYRAYGINPKFEPNIDHFSACPVAGLLLAPEGCEVESGISIDGCPSQKIVCPGAGCDKEPCQECEKCKDEWPTDCEPQYAPGVPVPPDTPTEAPCMPNGRTCTRDPVCEKWKCEEKKCKPGTKCVWKGGWTPSCEEAHFQTDTLLTCRLPKAVGPCRAAHRAWHYNSLTGQCQSFTYGGCNGNANRFDSKHECEELCDGVPSCTVEDLPEYSEGCVLESFIQEDGCPGFEMTCKSAVPVRAKPKEDGDLAKMLFW